MEETYKIRHLFYLGISFILLGMISSCQKMLDTHPTTEYASTDYWNETAQASAALNGAYNYLQNAFGNEFIYYGEGRTDNLDLNVENNANSMDVINNTLDATISLSDWGNFYQVIKQANLIIRNVKVMKDKNIYNSSNIGEYNRVLGQAYGLRAYTYFYMTRIWGNVPLLTEPVESNGDINAYKTPRTDTLVIYKQVEDDLDSARAILPATYSDAHATRSQITKGGIDAIYTDYYMWRNNMDSALFYSQQVLSNANYKLAQLYDPNINYFSTPSLIDNAEYARMFTQGFSSESIFEIAFSYPEGTISNFNSLYGFPGQSQFMATSNIVGKFDLSDLRLKVDFVSDVQVYKFFEKSGYDKVTQNDKNIILYRLSDIILLRAEALNALGKRGDAFTLVNQIRQRAGVATVTADKYNAFSTDEAEDYILDERSRELCFEGKRWYDLVRTGRAIPVMEPINGLNNPANLLWPISLNVIRQNPAIEQNNYYK